MTDLIESEDELLDPQPGPAAAAAPHRLAAAVHRLRARLPLGGGGSETDPARRRRMTLGALLALALAAGAGATGVIVHSRDLHTTQAHAQDRMLLRLLGGGATLTFDAGGPGTGTASNLPGTFGAPLNAYFTLALRNDGAKPLQVTGVGISVARGGRARQALVPDPRARRFGGGDRPGRRALHRIGPAAVPVGRDRDRAHAGREGRGRR